jgi:hypothetical protein
MYQYSGFRHFAQCCLQRNILPYWLVTSDVQCIPLHHKKFCLEGMVTDILTLCWFLLSCPFIDVKMKFQRTPFVVLINCSMFKAVTCMFICTFTNMNTNACHKKKLMVKIFLSYLQLVIIRARIFMVCHIFYLTSFSMPKVI